MKWVKINDGEISIRLAEMPDGSSSVVIFGLDKSSYAWDAAINNGFKVSISGRSLLRQGGVIKKREVETIFGKNISIVDVPKESVFLRRETPSNTANADSDTQFSAFLGLNFLGQRILSTATGVRYIQLTGQNEGVISEDSVLVPPIFLRSKNISDIDLCADGFVLRAETEFLRQSDLRRFCSVINGEDGSCAETDGRLRDLQEAVESASFRRVSKEFAKTGNIATTFQFAEFLNDRLPTAAFRTGKSIDLQQYSTPVALSIAAQNALGPVTGRVLEPSIGNASLVNTLIDVEITGVEIDLSRVNGLKRYIKNDFSSSEFNIIHGDFLEIPTRPGEFDAVIANPPFGGLKKAVQHDGLKVARIDHLIMLKALASRKDDGRSIFIIGSDHETLFDRSAGLISGGSVYLFNYLNDHYEIDAVEISGDLYKKQGAAFPVRMIAVGKKRNATEIRDAMATARYRFPAGHRLDVVRSSEELWNASLRLRAYLDVSSPIVNADASVKSADDDMVFGNDFQTQYIPLSGGDTAAMIPRNMSAAQQVAFERFTSENGDAREFVMRELRMNSLDDFEPEQIDAIALGIWNMKRGRALILADQTGMGKGRIVAGVARWAALNGQQCDFLTEKDSLFSDFWRDLSDIKSDGLFNPFIMNKDVSVVSTSGEAQEVLVQKTSDSARNEIVDSNEPSINFGYNAMFATYSQFNRSADKSKKSAYIAGTASRGAVVILDESHNAAGDSNTGLNITRAVMSSAAALYSSATYAKSSKNMSVYYKAFPKSINMTTLQETLDVGGEALQEIMSTMLCEDGVLVRREHDLSALKFKVLDVPDDIMKRNIRVSDQVSDILSAIALLSGDIEGFVRRLSKEIKKELESLSEEQKRGHRLGVSYQNFGSRLYNISRQISLVLSTDMAVTGALTALRNGQKPVIVLEQTFEGIISELLGDLADEDEQAGIRGNVLNPMTVKDLMGRLLDKVLIINIINGYGNPEKTDVFATAKSKAEKDAVDVVVNTIRARINDMDDMLAMPIDVMIRDITAAGYTVGEVSGRSFTNTFTPDGKVVRSERRSNKNAEIFAFNSGQKDAIILTRSGCTGISLHASEKFLDQRQRVLIEAQIANNVSERVQFFGRVNRRGQVSSPEIWSITSGLPWEIRLLAMQNMKLRKLSANTQSNRKSATEMDVPDLLNSVGNMVCKEYLSNNPEVAFIVGVDLDETKDDTADTEGESGCLFANRLTGRISLLRVAQQEEIYGVIISNFNNKIHELDIRGINPFEPHIFDVKANVVQRHVIVEGNDESKSSFDAPVFAQKIEWVKESLPRSFDSVMRESHESVKQLPSEVKIIDAKYPSSYTDRMVQSSLDKMGREKPLFVDMSDLKAKIYNDARNSCYDWIKLTGKLEVEDGDDINSIFGALEAKPDSFVGRVMSRTGWLVNNIEKLAPGSPITFSSIDGVVGGIVVSLKITQSRAAHLLGNYHVGIVVPGEINSVHLTANALFDDAAFDRNQDINDVVRVFEETPAGKITFSRWVLTGNLFRASEMVALSRIGSSGVYTDAGGARHRAIIMNPLVSLEDIQNMEITVNEEEARDEILRAYLDGGSRDFKFGDVTLNVYNDVFVMTVPGTKKAGGELFANKDLQAVTGEFSGTRQAMQANFTISSSYYEKKIRLLVGAIYASGRILLKDANGDTLKKRQQSI